MTKKTLPDFEKRLEDFFTIERLQEAGASQSEAEITRAVLARLKYRGPSGWVKFKNVGEFVTRSETARLLFNEPDLGSARRKLIVRVVTNLGLSVPEHWKPHMRLKRW